MINKFIQLLNVFTVVNLIHTKLLITQDCFHCLSHSVIKQIKISATTNAVIFHIHCHVTNACCTFFL